MSANAKLTKKKNTFNFAYRLTNLEAQTHVL